MAAFTSNGHLGLDAAYPCNVYFWDFAKPCQLARLGRPLPVGQVALYLAG